MILPTTPVTALRNMFKRLVSTLQTFRHKPEHSKKQTLYGVVAALDFLLIVTILVGGLRVSSSFISPLGAVFQNQQLKPLTQTKNTREVFGFAPYFTFNKLDNVDFNTLTTLAYFGIPVKADGSLDKTHQGYETFQSKKATTLFKKAHDHGTRVVLTITQMDNKTIRALMDDPAAQQRTITEVVDEVSKRGIDGVNIDYEYMGNPGPEYRAAFSKFVADMTTAMHTANPKSKVTVSVYASAVKDPKIYDIAQIGKDSDGVFMMAYDYAVASSDNAIPTAPLYGYKEGKYWYDISTAVADFTALMPSDKLILGVPWYGYNYAVNTPQIKAARNKGYYTYYKKGRKTYSNFVSVASYAQPYGIAQANITPEAGFTNVQTGWDDVGKVGWKSYFDTKNNVWRMIFLEDGKSTGIKYDFAKEKNLAGVGIWALGFEGNNGELWSTLREKFGSKLADSSIIERSINENN